MSRPERPDALAYACLYEEAILRGWVPNQVLSPEESSPKPAAIWARNVPNALPPGHLPVRPLGWYDPLGNFHRQTDHLRALDETLAAWTEKDARVLGLVRSKEGDWVSGPNETWPNGRVVNSRDEPERLRERLYFWLKLKERWVETPKDEPGQILSPLGWVAHPHSSRDNIEGDYPPPTPAKAAAYAEQLTRRATALFADGKDDETAILLRDAANIIRSFL